MSIVKIKEHKLNLSKVIEVSMENLGCDLIEQEFLMPLVKVSSTTYKESEIKEYFGVESLISYMKLSKDNAIFIPFLVDNNNGTLLIASGEVLEKEGLNFGDTEVKDDTIIGLFLCMEKEEFIIDLINFDIFNGKRQKISV